MPSLHNNPVVLKASLISRTPNRYASDSAFCYLWDPDRYCKVLSVRWPLRVLQTEPNGALYTSPPGSSCAPSGWQSRIGSTLGPLMGPRTHRREPQSTWRDIHIYTVQYLLIYRYKLGAFLLCIDKEEKKVTDNYANLKKSRNLLQLWKTPWNQTQGFLVRTKP